MSDSGKWNPELWKPIVVEQSEEPIPTVAPVRSFFDPQSPEETYEVRGILPRTDLAYRDQD